MRVSYSMLERFQECPYSFLLSHIQKIKPPKSLRSMFGIALHFVLLHLFFQELSEKAIEVRMKKNLPLSLFPKTKDSARKIWIRVWREVVKGEEANPKIVPFASKIKYEGTTKEEIQEEQERYLLWGIKIVERFWEIQVNSPPPFAVEFQFSVPAPHRNDIVLIGSIDLIRKVEGKYWLVDLKTGIGPKTKGWRDQYLFHHGYQFTIYSYAFRRMLKEEEAGIIIYPLNPNKNPKTQEIEDREAIFTFRTEDDYQELAELLDCFVRFLEIGKFPKYYGAHCRNCDFIEFCDNNNKIFVQPQKTGEIDFGKIESKDFTSRTLNGNKISHPRLF